MTLNSTLIDAGFRESNFTGTGKAPTTAESSEGLVMLQSLVNSFQGSIIGTRFKPWWMPAPFDTSTTGVMRWPAQTAGQNNPNVNEIIHPPANSRVFLRTTTATTIYMPGEPEDGAMMQFVDAGFTANVTLDGNGNFMGSTGVSYTATLDTLFGSNSRMTTKTYVFRADIASWTAIDALVLGAENPFPTDFDDYWITAMAIRLAPRFGNEPKQATVARYKEMVVFARQWYRQSAEALGIDMGTPTQNTYGGHARGLSDPDSGGFF